MENEKNNSNARPHFDSLNCAYNNSLKKNIDNTSFETREQLYEISNPNRIKRSKKKMVKRLLNKKIKGKSNLPIYLINH